MNDDLGRADGDGINLIVPQVVFSQKDSVGATAAWPEKRKEQQKKNNRKKGQSCKIWDLFKNTLVEHQMYLQVPIYSHYY